MVLPSRVVGLAMRAECKVIDHRRFEVSRLTDCTAVCFGHGGASQDVDIREIWREDAPRASARA
jgi:hypothetical protein